MPVPARRCRRLPWVLSAATCGAIYSDASAVDIFDVLPAALDQPQVNVQLRRPASPGEIVNFDPEDEYQYIFGAFLDTGASSHLLSNVTAGFEGTSDPDLLGMQIQREKTAGGQNVVFNDVGGGGEVQFNVSEQLIYQLAGRTLATSFADPADPDFRPVQSDFAPNSPPQRWQVGPSNQPLPDSALDLLLDPLAAVNVVGMPAMQNKVVVMDNRGVNDLAVAFASGDLEDLFDHINVLNTFVYDKATAPAFDPLDAANPQTSVNPGVPATNRHIRLSYADFSSYVSTTPAGSVAPDIAANPFVGVDPVRRSRGIAQEDVPGIKVAYEGASTEGSFLLDTGAGASFLSTELAQTLDVEYALNRGPGDPALGADPLLTDASGNVIPGQFKLTFSAFGADDPLDPNDSSSITVAGFFLDSLLVRTEEGDAGNDADDAHLNFVGAPVLVFDIKVTDPVSGETYALDGILGMNYLTASAIPPSGTDPFDITTMPGVFDWIVYDQAAGTLGLALVPEPSSAAFAAALIGGGVLRRRRPRQRNGNP
jgi:hypothetical protein